jgi:hypothetical protein
MYDVAIGAAYAVLFTVLGVFTLLAMIAAGYFGTSTIVAKLGCIVRPVAPTEDVAAKQMKSADFFLAARNSAGTV